MTSNHGTLREGNVAEWSAPRTRNPAVPGSSPALATCWICARSFRVQILGHACKQPTGCLLPVGSFHPVMLYLNYLFLIFEWSACKLAGQAKCSFHYKQAFNLFFFLTSHLIDLNRILALVLIFSGNLCATYTQRS